MRWLFSILISLALAAGIYFFYQTWEEYNVQQAELAFLEQERANFEKLKTQYAAQEEKVVLINSLWDEIESVGLDPNQWIQYPLAINRTISWEELDRLLLLAANNQADAGYWFMPRKLRVSRVVENLEGKAAEGGGEPVTVVAQGEEPAPETQRFATDLQGKFMIPKQK